MIPNLVLQERIISGIQKIQSYNYEFTINSLSFLVFIFAFFIIAIKKFNKKSKDEKNKNIENFCEKIFNYAN